MAMIDLSTLSGKVKIVLSLPVSCSWMPGAKWKRGFRFGFQEVKKSPSRLRRNRLRAEKYRAKKSTIQTIDKNCASSTTEEVLITEDFPVLYKAETDDDAEDLSNVNVMDYIEDYGRICDDDSSCEDVIYEDDASDSEDNEENHLVYIVFCETYVNVLRTGRICLSILGYKKEDMCWGSDNIKDRKWRKGEDVEWAPSGNTKKFFARNSEDRVFKEYYGFEFKEPGGDWRLDSDCRDLKINLQELGSMIQL